MVTAKQHEDRTVYMCDDCRLHYNKKKTAEKCETNCREHGMCNSEITEQSLERSESA